VTALTHPGDVIHCWDHLVMTLRSPDGAETGFLSLYAIAYSATLGAGHVAILEVAGSPDGPLAAVLADDPELGRRQGARLRAMGDPRAALTGTPRSARFERVPYRPEGFGFRIAWDGPEIEATWLDPDPPAWVDGQGGGFSDEEDIWALMVGAPRARLVVGGAAIPGEPFLDDVWTPKLGRPLSSAHAAFAEVRVRPVSDRARGSAPGGRR
jgi:hypothetical protein